MNSEERAFHEFAEFAAKLKGDEKREAQTFLFHLLEAFSHDANTLRENCTSTVNLLLNKWLLNPSHSNSYFSLSERPDSFMFSRELQVNV